MHAGGRSIVDVLKEAWKGEVQPTQAEMLADVIAQHNIKVPLRPSKIRSSSQPSGQTLTIPTWAPSALLYPCGIPCFTGGLVRQTLCCLLQVLIVHGENDALVPYSNSRRLAALLPNAQLVSMPRTGHVPHEERPAEFLKAVDAFLAAP